MDGALGYTGQRNSSSTGLMDYKARMYDPALKRFLQPDSIIPGKTSQSLNRYSYVLNSPIGFSDPTGHMQSCGVNGEDECQTDVPSPLPPNDWDNGGNDASGHHHPHGEEANDWEPTTFGDFAAYWAYLHKDDPNPPGIENDCTDFISKALLHAGMQKNPYWPSSGQYSSWLVAWELYSYLTRDSINNGLEFGKKVINNTPNKGEQSKLINNQNLQNFMKAGGLERGDLVFFTSGNYSAPNHVAIIVGFDKDHMPLIVEHNGPSDQPGYSLPRLLYSSDSDKIKVVSFVFLPKQAP